MPAGAGADPFLDVADVADVHEDPRYIRCANEWNAMQTVAPLVAAMHPMEPDHIHEELELQLPDFSSYHMEWAARAPRWRRSLREP